MTNSWILVADDPGIDNLVAAARLAGGDATALVVGDRRCAELVAASGVDKVVWLAVSGDAAYESFGSAVADLVATAAPDVVLAAARDSERVLLGAVAARTGAPILTLASEVAPGRVMHATFGGIAQETVTVAGPVLLLLDGGSLATGGSAPIEEVAVTAPGTLSVVETRPAAHEQVNLGKARRIVSVGRGLANRDDLALVEALAQRLGAEVACSRPLAEGLEWFTHDRYVGVTGQHVAPELYVALGISGQLQHVVGARSAGTVVVVNTDADAPYFGECDYGVVGDLTEVVPALTAALG